MNTWELLTKELHHFGIDLIDSKKCRIQKTGKVVGTIKAIKILNKYAKEQKRVLRLLWDEMIDVLKEEGNTSEIIDEKMVNLFVFSIKDSLKFLFCFEGAENTEYYNIITSSLTRDIKTFSKTQIYSVPDYKISIDWINRNICRLIYLCRVISYLAMGKKRVALYGDIVMAKGLAGPWTRLELPLEERKFPFGHGLQEREKGKEKQRRYRQGLMNYNNTSGGVGEGYYLREVRNEPFLWADRETEDPYPSRSQLSGRG
jgi:hypothetical protein